MINDHLDQILKNKKYFCAYDILLFFNFRYIKLSFIKMNTLNMTNMNNTNSLNNKMMHVRNHRHRRTPLMSCLKSNLLTLFTVGGVVGGIILGFGLRVIKDGAWPAREVLYVNFIGEIFLRMLKALILPLIVSSLISAIGSLDLSLSRRIGIRAICYYLVTTVCAVILGIIAVVIIHPGRGDSTSIPRSGTSRNVTTVDTLMDLFR